MSKRSRFFNLIAVLVCVLAGAGAAFAQGQILDAPRAAGTVGERYDGYAVVRGADSSLGSLVNSVNAQRRKVYNERAQKENVSADQIGRVYAAEILKSAPEGTWFLKEDGQWIRK